MRCKRCNKWSMTLNKQKLCKTCEAALPISSRTHHHSDDSFLPLSPTFDSDLSSLHSTPDFEPGGGSFGGGGSSGSWDSGSSDSGSSDCGSCGGSD